MPILLRCPVCYEALWSEPKSAVCQNNHRFDRARQGYLNLLPSSKKRSKNPGDDQMMVEARTRFLNHGYYQPVVDTLIDKLQSFGNEAPQRILDAGCGEGYYTSGIKEQLEDSAVCGFDIAKPAILAASKRNKAIEWLVASVSELPLMDEQFDAVISIFSRSDWPEFSRVLKPGGHIVLLTPGQNHLMALRRAIYDEVRPYPEDKRLQDLPEGLALLESQTIHHLMMLENTQAIMDLLAMTPHYWHVNAGQKQQLEQLGQLECELEMRLSVVQKRYPST
ncbi:putative RNA methyltransferase [Salinisphaera sp. G21_0]|uniref:putative RNA methyltransferase n=1 Tax=Salinisphaera sp. G21_0 TaxID=2821094 RepID=UPI001AD9A835|nr:methyltransferase domain-containing protein [Salinisphaera sp. G21_0]MBO9480776.1 methyltransferase domain-containing protein [Salinisphaera sp. G21_0]